MCNVEWCQKFCFTHDGIMSITWEIEDPWSFQYIWSELIIVAQSTACNITTYVTATLLQAVNNCDYVCACVWP